MSVSCGVAAEEAWNIMTKHKSFKRLVRTRMEKTGERYAAARAALLAADDGPGAEPAPLVTSDDAIRRRTGRGWEEWFDLLDAWGAIDRSHRDIARWVAEQLGVPPLEWGAQAITLSYERARVGRAVGERADGFAVTASRTVAIPAERLFDVLADEQQRHRWLPEGTLRPRAASRPKSLRFDWGDSDSRVTVTIDPRGDAKSVVTVEHSRLARGDAERTKRYWRECLSSLKSLLESGELDG